MAISTRALLFATFPMLPEDLLIREVLQEELNEVKKNHNGAAGEKRFFGKRNGFSEIIGDASACPI